MKCKKCGKIMEEGFGFDGKEWVLLDKDSVGLEPLFDFFCRDCVEKALSVLLSDIEIKKSLNETDNI
ncbi:MAG: hypothetical protein NT077_01480 [Candidatus Taylorbacteria bacterium]|nr:hypothetical protein [Candidatus Taylorbacteria bacterium]